MVNFGNKITCIPCFIWPWYIVFLVSSFQYDFFFLSSMFYEKECFKFLNISGTFSPILITDC